MLKSEAETSEKVEADAEAETRRSAKEVAERERDAERERKTEKAGIVRGPAERMREPAEKVTRTMKASCLSSYMKSARRWTWRAISMSTPTSSAARVCARLHKKREHDKINNTGHKYCNLVNKL